jgi:hypothetical protein
MHHDLRSAIASFASPTPADQQQATYQLLHRHSMLLLLKALTG